jgi:trk system potassium uptake protein TrkA
MRVAIAGAGAVGRSIARELVESQHQVMLIERELTQIDPASVEEAEWVHADACELASLEEAGVESCDVVIAATGDDKVNLVVSLLAKTEFGVRRVVARVNDPRNEWLFGENWGAASRAATSSSPPPGTTR